MSGNSPFAHGRDTGWSSGRYRGLLNWPTFRPPAALGDAASYDRVATALVPRGLALDPRSVYLLARVSPRHPTIEIRVADTLPTAAEATLFAGVLRALVATLLEDVRGDRPSCRQAARAPWRARLLAAARRGLDVPPARPREADAGAGAPPPAPPSAN